MTDNDSEFANFKRKYDLFGEEFDLATLAAKAAFVAVNQTLQFNQIVAEHIGDQGANEADRSAVLMLALIVEAQELGARMDSVLASLEACGHSEQAEALLEVFKGSQETRERRTEKIVGGMQDIIDKAWARRGEAN